MKLYDEKKFSNQFQLAVSYGVSEMKFRTLNRVITYLKENKHYYFIRII